MGFRRLLVGFILLVAPAVMGQDGRLVGQLYGDRAFGLGGAFTAFADDPSAAYYNPAGLAFGGDKMFAGSLQVFDKETLSLDGDFAPRPGSMARAQLTSETTGLFPTAGASLSKLSDNQFFSIASFTPLHRVANYSGVVSETTRGLTHSVTLSTNSEEKRTLVGPAYGLRLSKSFGIGAALYLSTYSFNRSSYRTKYIAENRNPNATTWSSTSQYSERYETQIESLAASPAVSLLYRGSQGLRFGAIMRLPSMPLLGDAKLSYRGFRFQNGGVITSELDGVGQADEPTTYNFTFGLGYEVPRKFAISFDTSVHLGTEVTSFELPSRFSASQGVDPDVPLTRKLNTVINYAAGLELYVTENLPLRVGAFTNYSANPEIPSLTSGVAYAPYLNELGGTVSFGYFGSKGSVHIGIGGAQSTGHVVLSYPEGTNQLPSRIDAEGFRYFVTLSGAVSFAKALVKKDPNQPEDLPLEQLQPAPQPAIQEANKGSNQTGPVNPANETTVTSETNEDVQTKTDDKGTP